MGVTDRGAVEEIEPTYFAEFVAALWRQQGWTVLPTSLDDGLYTAVRETAADVQRRLLFAVYRAPGGTVNAADVLDRARIDVVSDGITLVTNAGFSSSAVETAAAYGLDLVGADDLVRLVDALGAQSLLDSHDPETPSEATDQASIPSRDSHRSCVER